MKFPITHLILVAAFGTVATSCNSVSAVAVAANPDDGTVYYRTKGSEQLKVCRTNQDCTTGATIPFDVIDMEYVDGSLWITDGKQVRSCSLSGSCPGKIHVQLDKPAGIARAPGGLVYVVSASGKLARCSTNGVCEIDK